MRCIRASILAPVNLREVLFLPPTQCYGPEPPGPGQRHSIHLSINTLVGVLKPPSHLALSVARLNQSSAKLILTLKNRELIHFGFLLRGFVAKVFIHDT